MRRPGSDPHAPVANAPTGPQPPDLERDVRPPGAPDRVLHMIGNSHLDPVWLWPWQEGYQEARATFASAIQRMEEYPDFVFTCNQVVLLSWVEESDPALFEAIRRRVAEGRWYLAGGWWVEPDCNLGTGEAYVRQGLYGQRYLHEKFGVTATVGMNVDPFGHHAMLPQILRGQGMDSYCFMRPGPHEEPELSTLFRWRAPDGSEVLGYRIPHEYGSPPGDVSGHIDKTLGLFQSGPGATPAARRGDLMVFYGVGNHGGGPTRANIESIYRYDRMGTFGRVMMSSPRRYFDTVRADPEAVAALPVWEGDLQHHAPGCYSAHSGIKIWQRRAQAAVLAAERWSVVGAFVAGIDYPRADLGRAWRQILFNQFHDVLPGSAIESAYDDARDQLGEAVAIAKRAITRTHNVIASRIDIPAEPGTQPVVVFNPHPWPVTAHVELQYWGRPTGVAVVDGAGRPVVAQRTRPSATVSDQSRGAVVFEAEVPALGYRLYRLRTPSASSAPPPAEESTPEVRPTPAAGRPPAPAGAMTVTPTLLENDTLRVGFDEQTGWLDSLLDKRTGVDLVAGTRGPHTQICADPTDTWGHRVVSYAWPGEPMRLTSQAVVESGQLRGVVRVQRRWGDSTLTEEFVLGHRSDALEVRVSLDWREQAHLLKLRVPLALQGPEATYEIPFGSLRRTGDGTEEPAQTWVDVSGAAEHAAGATTRAGLALVNNAKHGFDVGTGAEPSIGMTAVRSPVYSWHDPRVLEPGDYVYQDQGTQKFCYLLVPHAGDWREADLTRRSAELGSPVRAMLEGFHDGPLPDRFSFAGDDGGPVVITALKGGEDDGPDGPDLVVRAVETTGRPARARIELPLAGRMLEAEFAANQIRTFTVPRHAAAPVVETDLIEWPLQHAVAATWRDEPWPDGRLPFGLHERHGPGRAASDVKQPAQVDVPEQHGP